MRTMMINGVQFSRLLFILVYFGFGCLMLSGQETDFQTAWDITLEKKCTPGLDLGLSLEQRFRENSLRYDRTLTTFEAAYGLGKRFGMATGARWILLKNTQLEYENRFRIHVNLNYKTGIRSVTISLRSMFQYGFDEQALRQETRLTKLYDRNRIELGYHFFGTKWTVQAGYELYTQLFNRESIVFCRSKTTVGIGYDISPHSSLALSYLYDHEFNTVNPLSTHMPGLSYRYRL